MTNHRSTKDYKIDMKAIDRARASLGNIERIVRAIRADLAADYVDSRSSAGFQQKASIHSSLSDFLAQAQYIHGRRVGPNEEFMPGLFIYYDKFEEGNSAIVDSVAFEPTLPDESGSSALVIKPILSAEQQSSWMTLQTDLDARHLKDNPSLAIRFIGSFRADKAPDLPNLSTSLRLFGKFNDGRDFVDLKHRTFPSLLSPLEYTVSITRDDLSDIDLENITSARFLINLPTDPQHRYDYIISHFEVVNSSKF